MYFDSPFHSNQAAVKERTYRETDGPALNTRHNSLEGLGVRERDGIRESCRSTPQSPAGNTVTHTTVTNIFSLTEKGKILELFFLLVAVAKQHLNQ